MNDRHIIPKANPQTALFVQIRYQLSTAIIILNTRNDNQCSWGRFACAGYDIMGFGLLQLSFFNQTVFYLYFFFPPGWNERLNDLFSTVWKLANVIKVQRHVNASPAAYNVFTCHRVTCGRNMLTVGESFSIYWQKQIDLVVEYDRMHLYSGFPAAGKPKDLPTPSVCVRRRLSARVRVAHAGECWPGSRLAAPVSIWC